jgi:hypothetical protein
VPYCNQSRGVADAVAGSCCGWKRCLAWERRGRLGLHDKRTWDAPGDHPVRCRSFHLVADFPGGLFPARCCLGQSSRASPFRRVADRGGPVGEPAILR